MTQIMEAEHFQSSFQPLDRIQFQCCGPPGIAPAASNSCSDATRKSEMNLGIRVNEWLDVR